MAVFQGDLQAAGRRFAVVVARFNQLVTQALLEGARDGLIRHGASASDIDVIWVPGSMELAPVAARLARSGRYDAVICLGAVVRGGTAHFEHVARETSGAIRQVALSSDVPVLFGVLTADDLQQAMDRAGGKMGNRGYDAAVAAVEMANLYRQLPPGAGRNAGQS
ncbi:MAG TPA: 6,7-dimethyl-8-ribityllumazine synthase [Limnochordales bacterium]